eukprot:290274-Amphidinium_carterae.1
MRVIHNVSWPSQHFSHPTKQGYCGGNSARLVGSTSLHLASGSRTPLGRRLKRDLGGLLKVTMTKCGSMPFLARCTTLVPV